MAFEESADQSLNDWIDNAGQASVELNSQIVEVSAQLVGIPPTSPADALMRQQLMLLTQSVTMLNAEVKQLGLIFSTYVQDNGIADNPGLLGQGSVE